MIQKKEIILVECPRDAMQGWKKFIPTQTKINYLNALLQVGFDTIDFGSFVSHKAIPQMADTKDVVKQLKIQDSKSKLLAIVANVQGASDAIQFEQISYLGFPFSLSPSFQMRNTNSTIEQSLVRLSAIQELCIQSNKELVVYLSMGFGNPYGDKYNEEILLQRAAQLIEMDIKIISLADTIGIATPEQISFALNTLIPAHPGLQLGVHLHSTTENWRAKIEAAVNAGCTRLDGALKGIGGCPMAGDELVGNLSTELILSYLEERKLSPPINSSALQRCLAMVPEVFE